RGKDERSGGAWSGRGFLMRRNSAQRKGFSFGNEPRKRGNEFPVRIHKIFGGNGIAIAERVTTEPLRHNPRFRSLCRHGTFLIIGKPLIIGLERWSNFFNRWTAQLSCDKSNSRVSTVLKRFQPKTIMIKKPTLLMLAASL